MLQGPCWNLLFLSVFSVITVLIVTFPCVTDWFGRAEVDFACGSDGGAEEKAKKRRKRAHVTLYFSTKVCCDCSVLFNAYFPFR